MSRRAGARESLARWDARLGTDQSKKRPKGDAWALLCGAGYICPAKSVQIPPAFIRRLGSSKIQVVSSTICPNLTVAIRVKSTEFGRTADTFVYQGKVRAGLRRKSSTKQYGNEISKDLFGE